MELPVQPRHENFWILQQWIDQVTEALQPFIPDHAQQFAQHLLAFLVSRLSVAAYDRLVFGKIAGPSQAQTQSSSGISSMQKFLSYSSNVEVAFVLANHANKI